LLGIPIGGLLRFRNQQEPMGSRKGHNLGTTQCDRRCRLRSRTVFARSAFLIALIVALPTCYDWHA
jgi:hypothetical protein